MEIVTGKDLGLKSVRGRLVPVSEIAVFMRTSERWIQSHMHDGTFPVRWFLLGDRNRAVDSEDLDEWLSKIAVKAGDAELPENAKKKLRKKEVSA